MSGDERLVRAGLLTETNRVWSRLWVIALGLMLIMGLVLLMSVKELAAQPPNQSKFKLPPSSMTFAEAEKIPDDEERALAFLALAAKGANTNHREMMQQAMDLALQTVVKIPNSQKRLKTLDITTKFIASAYLFAPALKAAEQFPIESEDRLLVYVTITKTPIIINIPVDPFSFALDENQFRALCEAVDQLKDPDAFARASASVAHGIGEAAFKQYQSTGYRRLKKIDPSLARQRLSLALRASGKIENLQSRDQTLWFIAKMAASARFSDEALEAVDKISDHKLWFPACEMVAAYVGNQYRPVIRRRIMIADPQNPPDPKTDVYTALSGAAADIRDPQLRSRVYSKLMAYAIKSQYFNSLVKPNTNNSDNPFAFYSVIAVQAAEVGQLEKVIEVVKTQMEPFKDYRSRNNFGKKAFDAPDAPDLAWQCEIFSAMTRGLVKAEKPELAKKTLETLLENANQVSDEDPKDLEWYCRAQLAISSAAFSLKEVDIAKKAIQTTFPQAKRLPNGLSERVRVFIALADLPIHAFNPSGDSADLLIQGNGGFSNFSGVDVCNYAIQATKFMIDSQERLSAYRAILLAPNQLKDPQKQLKAYQAMGAGIALERFQELMQCANEMTNHELRFCALAGLALAAHFKYQDQQEELSKKAIALALKAAIPLAKNAKNFDVKKILIPDASEIPGFNGYDGPLKYYENVAEAALAVGQIDIAKAATRSLFDYCSLPHDPFYGFGPQLKVCKLATEVKEPDLAKMAIQGALQALPKANKELTRFETFAKIAAEANLLDFALERTKSLVTDPELETQLDIALGSAAAQSHQTDLAKTAFENATPRIPKIANPILRMSVYVALAKESGQASQTNLSKQALELALKESTQVQRFQEGSSAHMEKYQILLPAILGMGQLDEAFKAAADAPDPFSRAKLYSRIALEASNANNLEIAKKAEKLAVQEAQLVEKSNYQYGGIAWSLALDAWKIQEPMAQSAILEILGDYASRTGNINQIPRTSSTIVGNHLYFFWNHQFRMFPKFQDPGLGQQELRFQQAIANVLARQNQLHNLFEAANDLTETKTRAHVFAAIHLARQNLKPAKP